MSNGIDFDFEADDLAQSDGASKFELIIGGLVRIAGTVRIDHGAVVFGELVCPAGLGAHRARLFVSQAILRGQGLGIRRPLLRRVRAALQS